MKHINSLSLFFSITKSIQKHLPYKLISSSYNPILPPNTIFYHHTKTSTYKLIK